MNERIKELARTAERKVQISLGERWTTIGRAEFMRLYNHMFAELLIQDAISIVQSFRCKMDASNDNIVDALKQHFGVGR